MKVVDKIFYLVLLIIIVVFSYVFVDPNLQFLQSLYSGFATTYREITTMVFVLFLVLFFSIYIRILQFVHKKILGFSDIKWYITVSIGILLFAYPAMLSYDIFNYILTAKVLVFYHENPYIIMPIEFNGEPYLNFTRAANKIALYGPLWTLGSSIPYVTGFGNFLITLLSFKFFVTIFYGGLCYLLWKISKNVYSLAAFALNPLVVIETLVSGHNDVVMMFLVMASFYLLHKKKLGAAVVFLLLSILIKYVSVFLIPVFIFIVFKTIKKQKINWEVVYKWSAISMLIIFFLSAFREEIYPWYALWFLPFLVLTDHKKPFFVIGVAFTISLLLRYIPYMATGNYFGSTPIIKIILTFSLPAIVVVYLILKKVWRKRGSA